MYNYSLFGKVFIIILDTNEMKIFDNEWISFMTY